MNLQDFWPWCFKCETFYLFLVISVIRFATKWFLYLVGLNLNFEYSEVLLKIWDNQYKIQSITKDVFPF